MEKKNDDVYNINSLINLIELNFKNFKIWLKEKDSKIEKLEVFEKINDVNLLCKNEIEYILKSEKLFDYSNIIRNLFNFDKFIYNELIFLLTNNNTKNIKINIENEIKVKNFFSNRNIDFNKKKIELGKSKFENYLNMNKKKLIVRKEESIDIKNRQINIEKEALNIYNILQKDKEYFKKLDFIEDPMLLIEICKLFQNKLKREFTSNEFFIKDYLNNLKLNFENEQITVSLKSIYEKMIKTLKFVDINKFENDFKNILKDNLNFEKLILAFFEIIKKKNLIIQNNSDINNNNLKAKKNYIDKQIQTNFNKDLRNLNIIKQKEKIIETNLKEINNLKIKLVKFQSKDKKLKIKNNKKDTKNLIIKEIEEENKSLKNTINDLKIEIYNLNLKNEEYNKNNSYYINKIENLEKNIKTLKKKRLLKKEFQTKSKSAYINEDEKEENSKKNKDDYSNKYIINLNSNKFSRNEQYDFDNNEYDSILNKKFENTYNKKLLKILNEIKNGKDPIMLIKEELKNFNFEKNDFKKILFEKIENKNNKKIKNKLLEIIQKIKDGEDPLSLLNDEIDKVESEEKDNKNKFIKKKNINFYRKKLSNIVQRINNDENPLFVIKEEVDNLNIIKEKIKFFDKNEFFSSNKNLYKNKLLQILNKINKGEDSLIVIKNEINSLNKDNIDKKDNSKKDNASSYKGSISYSLKEINYSLDKKYIGRNKKSKNSLIKNKNEMEKNTYLNELINNLKFMKNYKIKEFVNYFIDILKNKKNNNNNIINKEKPIKRKSIFFNENHTNPNNSLINNINKNNSNSNPNNNKNNNSINNNKNNTNNNSINNTNNNSINNTNNDNLNNYKNINIIKKNKEIQVSIKTESIKIVDKQDKKIQTNEYKKKKSIENLKYKLPNLEKYKINNNKNYKKIYKEYDSKIFIGNNYFENLNKKKKLVKNNYSLREFKIIEKNFELKGSKFKFISKNLDKYKKSKKALKLNSDLLNLSLLK